MRIASYFVALTMMFFMGRAEAQTPNQTPGTQFVAGQNWYQTGFSGDGGPAVNARINGAHGGSFDAYGNFFFADRFNRRIRKISSSGIITTVVGNGVTAYAGDGGPAVMASLASPHDVVVLPSGELLIADGNRIRKVFVDGTINTIVGGTVVGPIQQEMPALGSIIERIVDIDISPNGEIWFSTEKILGNHGTLLKLSSDGTTVSFPYPGLAVGGSSSPQAAVFTELLPEMSPRERCFPCLKRGR